VTPRPFQGGSGARDDRRAPELLWECVVVPGSLAEELAVALDRLEAYEHGVPLARRQPARLSRAEWVVREFAREAALRFRAQQEAHGAYAAAIATVLTPAQAASQSGPEITTEQAATIAGVSTVRIRQLAMSGDIKGRKAARNVWLLDPESVRAYAQRRGGRHGDTHSAGHRGTTGAGAA